MTDEEITEILQDFSPPYVEGTCYPVRRFELLYGVRPTAEGMTARGVSHATPGHPQMSRHLWKDA